MTAPLGGPRAGLFGGGGGGGPAIPDSLTDQWRMDEGSGTSISNNLGPVDGSLSGAGWDSDAESVGDTRTTYDGTDDSAKSNSAFGINQSQMTVVTWFTTTSGSTTQFIVSSVTQQIDTATDGWRIDISNNQVRFGHRSTGNGFTVTATLDDGGGISANERYMVAHAMDGNSATSYLFDNNGLIASASGSGARTTSFNSTLYLATREEDNSFNLSGTLDAPALARSVQMPQSEIEEYRAATSP